MRGDFSYTATVKRGFASADGPCNIQAVIKSKHAAYLRFSPNPSFDARQQTMDFGKATENGEDDSVQLSPRSPSSTS